MENDMKEETKRKIEKRRRRFAEKGSEKEHRKEEEKEYEGLKDIFGEQEKEGNNITSIIFNLIALGIVLFVGTRLLDTYSTIAEVGPTIIALAIPVIAIGAIITLMIHWSSYSYDR
jgi:hypothetical protein